MGGEGVDILISKKHSDIKITYEGMYAKRQLSGERHILPFIKNVCVDAYEFIMIYNFS